MPRSNLLIHSPAPWTYRRNDDGTVTFFSGDEPLFTASAEIKDGDAFLIIGAAELVQLNEQLRERLQKLRDNNGTAHDPVMGRGS
jgi:hypothetical protein